MMQGAAWYCSTGPPSTCSYALSSWHGRRCPLAALPQLQAWVPCRKVSLHEHVTSDNRPFWILHYPQAGGCRTPAGR